MKRDKQLEEMAAKILRGEQEELTEASLQISPKVKKMAVDMVGDLIFSIEDLIEDTGMDPKEAIEEWIEQMGTEVYDLVVPILKEHYKLKTIRGFR